ncbi:MAG TPA: EamA family transporter [Crocinitomicaceae bacterium]|nr:EamA family transporter [Crocinitomicaceae bacterium]
MKYYLSAILSVTIWGTFALVLKPLSAYMAWDILIHRVIFATICIIFISFLFRRKPFLASIHYLQALAKNERKKLLLNMFLSAVVLGFNWFSFIYVMNEVSVSATSLAYMICPILTTVLASIFLREKLNKGQWFAVFLSVISCAILAYGHFMDLIYSMIVALSYAVYLILQKNTFQLDKFFTLTVHIVVSTILLLPVLTIIDTSVPKTNTFYGLIAIIAVVYTIIPLFLNLFALKKLDSSVVGTFLYLNPIISFLLAILYYKEPITTERIIAFGIIFIAVLIFNVAHFWKRKEDLKSVV